MKNTAKIRGLITALLLQTVGLAAEKTGDWTVLFDGRNLDEWHAYGTGGKPGWVIADGALTTVPKGRDIASNRKFGDFELVFEWKISPGGNSGVMYRVDEVPTESGTRSGPEYQILDDARHKDGRNPLTSAGSLYALYAPAKSAARAVGEWNESRIVVRGSAVRYWLNGSLIVEAEIGSADWKERIAHSKFVSAPRYAQSREGAIVLQDHGFPVWYRAMRVRPL